MCIVYTPCTQYYYYTIVCLLHCTLSLLTLSTAVLSSQPLLLPLLSRQSGRHPRGSARLPGFLLGGAAEVAGQPVRCIFNLYTTVECVFSSEFSQDSMYFVRVFTYKTHIFVYIFMRILIKHTHTHTLFNCYTTTMFIYIIPLL